MDHDNRLVIKYFSPSQGTFWKWSDDYKAIEWLSGTTIVFDSELLSLLATLAHEGLPPLENVLLALAACRNRADVASWRLAETLDFKRYPMGHSLVELLDKTLSAVNRVITLPEQLRTSAAGKRAILALICENGPRRATPKFSADCLEWLSHGATSLVSSNVSTKPTSEWNSVLRGLHDGLLAVNETAVRLRMQTGLEVTPSVAPVPLPLALPKHEPAPLTVRELLNDLEQDEQYAGLVRLTRRLLAFVSLPRLLSTPDTLHLGGVSDITNRGPFDRLLLSELANDTDVLMTRVALNEAMYIRREVPPTFPTRQCLILVDTGIRMWGLPRLYATAVALAFAVVEDAKTALQLFRATGNGHVAIDLTSRAQLIAHLESLELAVHPGESLAQLVAETTDTAAADLIVVTGEDVLADPDFQQVLANLPLANFYVAAVTRDGGVRLLQRTRQGERVLKQAELDLEQILTAPKKQVAKLRNTAIDPQLPAICRVRPFPLYLSTQILPGTFGHGTDRQNPDDKFERLLAITNDRRLLVWDRPGQRASQLSDCVPPGKLLWYDTNLPPSGTARIIIGNKTKPQLVKVTASPEAEEIQSFDLPFTPPIQDIGEHAGIIYVVFKHLTVLFSFDTCQRLAVLEHPARAQWLSGRFFSSSHESWFAVTYDGQTASWQQLLRRSTLNGAFVGMIFDCQCLAAPVAFTTHNTVVVTGSNEEIEFETRLLERSTPVKSTHIGGKNNAAMHVTALAHDGNRFVVTNPTDPSKTTWFVDLKQRTVQQAHGMPPHLLDQVAYNSAVRRHVRNRFTAVGVVENRMVLITPKGQPVAIVLSEEGTHITLQSQNANNPNLDCRADFRYLQAPSNVGYEFKVAQWADGSRAILDSRGLLHLQSRDPAIPEMTLVLNDADVAGWCNQNLVWGNQEFTGDVPHRISPETVFHKWLTPFCRRLK